MKVIGAGFGRTGSDSLRHALNRLGYRTYHMYEVGEGDHLPLWNALAARVQADPVASAGGPIADADADAILDVLAREPGGGFNATTDFPVCLLYDHLLRRNPDARVILGVRASAAQWAASYRRTIGRMHALAHTGLMRAVLGPLLGFVNDRAGLPIGPGNTPTPEDVAMRAYEAWIARVRATVPPEQLLVFEAGGGWAPLCMHLGIDPSSARCPASRGEPFPRTNQDTAVLIAASEWLVWLGPYVVLLLVAALAACLLRCRSRCKHWAAPAAGKLRGD